MNKTPESHEGKHDKKPDIGKFVSEHLKKDVHGKTVHLTGKMGAGKGVDYKNLLYDQAAWEDKPKPYPSAGIEGSKSAGGKTKAELITEAGKSKRDVVPGHIWRGGSVPTTSWEKEKQNVSIRQLREQAEKLGYRLISMDELSTLDPATLSRLDPTGDKADYLWTDSQGRVPRPYWEKKKSKSENDDDMDFGTRSSVRL